MDRNIRHLEMYNACSHPFFTDGEVISYYNKKDSLIKWETFYKNRKIIKLREYYQTGELYYEMPIRKCARHGNVKYYHKNGTVLYDIHYNYGFKNGIITEYFENNTTKKIINYKDNLRHGEYLEYDSLGVLITKHKYYEGELIH